MGRDIYEMITDGIVGFKCKTKDNYLYRKRKIILQTSYIGNRLSKTKTKTKFFDELTSELQNIKSEENIGSRHKEKHNIGRRSGGTSILRRDDDDFYFFFGHKSAIPENYLNKGIFEDYFEQGKRVGYSRFNLNSTASKCDDNSPTFTGFCQRSKTFPENVTLKIDFFASDVSYIAGKPQRSIKYF